MEAKFSKERLEHYFEDLRALFMKRFCLLNLQTDMQESDGRRLTELLRELIYIKGLIEDNERNEVQ